ncbi:MAG TPA: hypothetical protein VGB43_01290, partial [Flavobacterium sp.]
ERISTSEKIVELLRTKDLSSREIQKLLMKNESDVIFALKELLENEAVEILSNNEYTLRK